MLEASLDVEAATIRARDRECCQQVDHDSGQCHGEDQARLYVGGRDQAPHCLDSDQRGQHQQRDPVHLRGEDLNAPQTEGHLPSRRPPGQSQGEQRKSEGSGVGEHVSCVGEQRQRVGDQADRDLRRHQAEDQRQREEQPAAIGLGRASVAGSAMLVRRVALRRVCR